jgi:hypothetical protein
MSHLPLILPHVNTESMPRHREEAGAQLISPLCLESLIDQARPINGKTHKQ